MDGESFAKKLKKWRSQRGSLQKEAADVLSVPLDTYRQWENAASEPHQSPSMAEILKRMEDAK